MTSTESTNSRAPSSTCTVNVTLPLTGGCTKPVHSTDTYDWAEGVMS